MSEEEKNKRSKQERNRYYNSSEEQKNKIRERARNMYHSMIKAW